MSPSARRLSDRVDGVRTHLVRRAAVALVPWATAGVAVVLAVAWLVAGWEGWRQGTNVPLALDVVAVLWIVAGVVVIRRGARRWFGEVPLSRSIERAAGMEPGTVRGSLELSRAVPRGVSGSLAEGAVAKAASGLEPRTAEDLSGDLGRGVSLWARRGLIVASVLVVVLAVLGVAQPDRTARAWAGVSAPFATMVDPVLAPIAVSPGSIEVPRGTDVRVQIEAGGRVEVALIWQETGEVVRSETLALTDGGAGYVFEAVSAPTEYRVRASDGMETELFTIVPIDPLFVSDLVVGVTYPPHTGLPPDEYRGDTPPLRLPAGSVLAFEGLSSRPLSSASLRDSLGTTQVALDVDGEAFGAVWTPREGGLFDWVFLDGDGAQAEIQPEPLDISLVADASPAVTILQPGQDTVLPLSLQQPLVIDARDDYGLRRVELVAYRVTSFGERKEPVVQGLALGGTRAALARPVLDVSSWGLLPGDTVRYFARVIDNHPSQQVGTSPEYVLRMPAAAEMRRDAEASLESVAQRLDEMRDEAARQAEANRDQALADAARRPAAEPRPEPDAAAFERREEMQRALDDQADLIEQVDSLRMELQALERALEEAGQADPELSRELGELQEMLREMSGGELQERMENLAQAMQENDDQANRDLSQMAAEQERFRQRVEEALDRVRQAAVQQDFRATTQEAQDLARQEQALADAMREDGGRRLRQEQQAALSQRAEDLGRQMERLSRRLEQMGEPRAASDVERAQQYAERARERMEQAQQQAQQGDAQAAGDQAQQAAQQMQQAAQEMQDAQGGMQEETDAEAQAALMQAMDDALSLARRQADLRQRMEGAGPQERAAMRSEEASLQQGLDNIAQNLQQGTQAGGSDPELSAQMGRAMESMAQTAQALENARTPESAVTARADQAVSDLNQLAMMAMQGAQQAGNPSGSGQSNQDLAAELGQLAQRQGQLLMETGELMPMQLGQQAMQQQLGGLSQQQQAVSSELGRLAGEPGSDDALGDLSRLSDQAAELAERMAEGRLTPEIVRDQEQLFNRLLDAGRSLEQEERSEERESERAGAFERGEVVPLSALQLGALAFELPDGAQMRELTPALRQLVLEYFERLNAEGAEPEAGR